MTMPEDPVRDTIRRTIRNYEFVDDHVLRTKDLSSFRDGDQGPFEVTQLLNSFLGVLVHPWERMQRRHADLDCGLEAAKRRGWPVLESEWQWDKEPKSFEQMLQWMRNAFAHGNIELIPDGRGDIAAVRLWNQCGCGNRSWGTKMTVENLHAFLRFFSTLAEDRLPRPDPAQRRPRNGEADGRNRTRPGNPDR